MSLQGAWTMREKLTYNSVCDKDNFECQLIVLTFY